MKRTTLMLDEDLLLALDQSARRRRLTRSQAIREAIAAYTSRHGSRRRKLSSFAGVGKSGYRGSLGKDAKALLRKGATRKGWK